MCRSFIIAICARSYYFQTFIYSNFIRSFHAWSIQFTGIQRTDLVTKTDPLLENEPAKRDTSMKEGKEKCFHLTRILCETITEEK